MKEGIHPNYREVLFVDMSNDFKFVTRSTINTRETAWWRFFSSTDYYDPDRMNYDKELLRKFYLTQGSFKNALGVIDRKLRLSPDDPAWLYSKGYVSIQLKAYDDAIAALSVKLSADEIKLLEELYQPHPYPPGDAFA